ncbi:MAG: MBL fold metallo-hydrolase [Candidatus Micrarchaeota archaeon]
MRKSSLAFALAFLLIVGGAVLVFNATSGALTGYWSFVNPVAPLGGWMKSVSSRIAGTAAARETAKAAPRNCGQLEIDVINVGQADSIFIKTPRGKTILIDTGSGMTHQHAALNFLKNTKKIAALDFLIISHNHEDHIGGLADIRTLPIGEVYGNNCNDPLVTNELLVPHDMIFNVGDSCIDATLMVAYDGSSGCFSNENDNSVLLKLDYGTDSFLFTGDCGTPCESELIQQGAPLGADFLKVGHHGSDSSTTALFLEKVRATYYALSVDAEYSIGKGYHHPRNATMNRIYGYSQELGRTDINGNIYFYSKGGGISMGADRTAESLTQLFCGFYYDKKTKSYDYVPVNGLTGACNFGAG